MGVSLTPSEFRNAERSGSPAPTQQFTLSYAQETMLFWDRLVPRSAAYNVPVAFHLRGRLDVAALRKTIQLILARHEILRSHFVFADEDPVQVVRAVPSPEACLSIVEVPYSRAAADSRGLQQMINAAAQRPFDLAKDVLLRALLFRLAETQHALLLNMHHIAGDGWSLGILVRELSEAYFAFSRGNQPQLSALPGQYAAFAKWQRNLAQTPEWSATLSFWREQLRSLPEFSDLLQTDRPRPAQQTFTGATLRTSLPQPLVTALTELGQMRRATLFMVMLAALQILLQRSSGKNDIPVGVPLANRNRTEFQDLIGCFMNMVVIRGDLSGNPDFLTVLSRLRETALAGFFHPEVPFSELVRHLHPKRALSHTPFFQVQLAFQSYPMPDINWPGLEITRLDVDTATSKFDLSVVVEPKNGLEIGFEYNTSLFTPDTMKRLLRQYTSILQKAVRNPNMRITDFPAEADTLSAATG
jgi:Condensation domain